MRAGCPTCHDPHSLRGPHSTALALARTMSSFQAGMAITNTSMAVTFSSTSLVRSFSASDVSCVASCRTPQAPHRHSLTRKHHSLASITHPQASLTCKHHSPASITRSQASLTRKQHAITHTTGSDRPNTTGRHSHSHHATLGRVPGLGAPRVARGMCGSVRYVPAVHCSCLQEACKSLRRRF